MNPLAPTEWLTLGLGVALAVGAGLAWLAAARCSRPLRLVLVGLRFLALLGLAVLAFNPGRWLTADAASRREWAILIDRSRSMATADVDGGSRWDRAVALARAAAAQAGTAGDVRLLTFAAGPESATPAALAAAPPTGEATDLVRAAGEVLAPGRGSGGRLVGLLLLTDGRQTEPGNARDLAIRARAQSTPIYPVVLGGPVPRRDLAVEPRRRQYFGFAGRPLRVVARVRAQGLGPITPGLTLADAAGTTLAERRLELAGDTETDVTFEVVPAAAGYLTYNLRVPPWEGDRDPTNNQAAFGVAALAEGVRTFVAEGSPNWDSKFFVQLLRQQPNLAVTAVYRLTAERFFRVDAGLDRAEEAADRAIFPDTAAELARYDAVVLGKGAEYFLTSARIARLRAFIRDHGGCLVCARGKPSTDELPELDALLPGVWRASPGRALRFRPTATGRDVGLFGELLADPSRPLWSQLPPLAQEFELTALQSFAQVLADGTTDTGRQGDSLPVVVSRRFGKGLVVVVNAERFWHWDFFPQPKEGGTIYDEFWGQLLLWALTYSEFAPGQAYALGLSESRVYPDTPVRVRVTSRDPAAAAPTLELGCGDTALRRLQPAPLPDGGGRYQALVSLSEPGTYRVAVAGQDAAASTVGAVLRVEPRPGEEAELSADPEFLRTLAEASGGRVLEPSEVETVLAAPVQEPPRDQDEVREWEPHWANGGYLSLLSACLALEWFLRRRHGRT